MLIKDTIYGNSLINSPVLIELINSQPVQRLKNISQYGLPIEYYHIKIPVNRYDHSIGVMLLLKKLKATEEEQIAGLLHDISHTAFSHVIDWVLGDGKTEDFQNIQHEKFMEKSEIAKILKQYNYDAKKIANHKNYSLLEQEIPDLCADRIDYSIREFPLSKAKYCLENMTVKNTRIVFKNKKAALIFAKNFIKRQITHWGGFEAATRYRFLANALKTALAKKIINFEDFWKDDNYIMNKLINSNDKEINKILSILKEKSLKKLPKSQEKVLKKFRFVDPEYISQKKVRKLSNEDKNFKKILQRAREINFQGVLIPII